jgi:protein TonB
MLALAIPGDGAGAYGAYLALLRQRVQEAVTYPAAARRRGASGTVDLEIALEGSGVISEVKLVNSSSYRVLDDAALEAVRGLRRVPFPADVRPRALRVRLPVVFELR